MKILLVDDEEELLASLARLLRMMGHDVVCFTSAREAAAAYDEGCYDFAFIDYLMPQENGSWFMKNIKNRRKTKILLMTALTNPGIITEMMRLGALGYMIKPFEEEEIKMQLAFHSRLAS